MHVCCVDGKNQARSKSGLFAVEDVTAGSASLTSNPPGTTTCSNPKFSAHAVTDYSGVPPDWVSSFSLSLSHRILFAASLVTNIFLIVCCVLLRNATVARHQSDLIFVEEL